MVVVFFSRTRKWSEKCQGLPELQKLPCAPREVMEKSEEECANRFKQRQKLNTLKKIKLILATNVEWFLELQLKMKDERLLSKLILTILKLMKVINNISQIEGKYIILWIGCYLVSIGKNTFKTLIAKNIYISTKRKVSVIQSWKEFIYNKNKSLERVYMN